MAAKVINQVKYVTSLVTIYTREDVFPLKNNHKEAKTLVIGYKLQFIYSLAIHPLQS